MSRNPLLALALAPFLLATACTDANKVPAEQALRAAESAVSALGDEVNRLAPEQVQQAKDALTSAKTLAAKQDWKGALAAAGDVPNKVKAALAYAQAKKDEAAKQLEAIQKSWSDATAALPGQLSAIKDRMAALAKAKKLPKGVTKATLGKAKAALTALEEGWAKVQEQFKSDAAGAIAKATELGAKARDLAKQLKLK